MRIAINKLNIGLLVLLLLVVGVSLLQPNKASALSGSDFRAGNIIDNSVFYDGNAMTATQIQEFINAKVPECDTNGTKPSNRAGYATRADWGRANGYAPPYTCLKNYSENTPTKTADSYCPSTYTGGVKTAAQIIRDVGVACGISQKTLIVLLQKEQSLITDDWPWSIQYRSATGYGCPDTAPCDAEYYGFFNQVYNASRQFKRYVIQSELFNYRSGTTRYIQYNPNAGCGGSNVYIENPATAALYNYTPYQPNASALNNLYGSGDTCGAYGNRNFWRMFNDWFGSTVGIRYSWQLQSQSVFTDETKSTYTGTSGLVIGSRIYMSIVIRNTGSVTWNNSGANPTRLGTIRPYERRSAFCDPTWLSCSRPALMVESVVAPGESATFNFWMKAPSFGINSTEYFAPVIENATWLPDIGLFYNMNVTPPTYTWQMTSQYAYTDSTKTVVKNLANLVAGEKAYIGFTARNTGNQTWQNSGPNAILVGTVSPQERLSVFGPGSSWPSGTRPALLKEASVAPGQTGTFEFLITAPSSPGVRNERFGLIANGLTWFNDTGLSFYTKIQ